MSHEAGIVPLVVRGDERGWLVVVEEGGSLPFCSRRIYYIGGTLPGVRRGRHAHRRGYQAAVCVHGACSFLLDDGRGQTTIRMDRPDRALLLPPMLWHEMFDFTPDCVLLVFADSPYDESDYIRDYSDFCIRAAQ